MSYVGSSAAVIPVGFSGVNSQSFNGDGSTVAFTLNRPVSAVNAIEVMVNNVQQSPYDGSYSVSSTTLTFSAAPSSGTANIYVVYRDFPVGSITDPNTYTKAQTDTLLDARVAKTGDTMTGNLNQVKSMTSQYDGIGVLMGSSTANTNRSATLLQHTYIDAGGNQGNYVYNHSLRQTDGAYIANVYTADYSAGVHSWYNPNGGLSGNVVMRIDSAGRVTMPYQPAFRATSDDGSQSLTNNVNAVAIFDVAETNIGSHYNTLNGKFTAPISGFYGFSSSLLISQGGANRIDLMFYKNGSAWVAHEFKDYGAVSSNSSVTASMHGYLNSNDYVEVVVMIGGANGSIYSEPKFWNFSGYLVG